MTAIGTRSRFAIASEGQAGARSRAASAHSAIAVSIAAVRTEGTEEYGDQVVCRVNGLPAEDEAIPAEDGPDYFETCDTMPAAFAYWSLWVKPAGGEWGYAQEGAATQELQPGDAVELLFTLNGEPAAPAS